MILGDVVISFYCLIHVIHSLKKVPVTPDKNWKYVGKTNPVPLKDVPILVKEMRESFFTHKYLFLYQ